ncbi:hypothetical protein FDENT_4513 [Fusarium denticulatum]|uniref:Uncharacterized protein n=1 Tax=Fusarium denticulatum TaxID=48507 RepID=A0A8H5XBR4_9HYPO|nr:hypothetical protein FDENT_4513 [Fusarium denticulatum]
MSANDLEAAEHRHRKIQKTIESWNTCNEGFDLPPHLEFADLQTEFQKRLFLRQVHATDIPKILKMLQDAEAERVATARANILEKMHKKLFSDLCQNFGLRLCKKWFNEIQVNNRLSEDTTPSNNVTQSSSEQTVDDVHCSTKSSRKRVRGSNVGKAPRTSSRPILCNLETTSHNNPKGKEAISFKPTQDGYIEELDCEPLPSRVQLRTKGEDETPRPSKRPCVQKPEDTRVELDDEYSSDQSNETAPFTDDSSEACTEYCFGDKIIENEFVEVSQDGGDQST